ncbi:hypothetical protein CROQUDRAFT_103736 [Cronartium quercuum f. sp. fusiforme G11]|uniref:PUM-HD domain-containing protein n=1 Tax=Cronartium quercuum f. sp. fusiforme G11 TaxID=708437 RepID=A0A9P6NQF9_9BASI|nr:hypothetical protein CROQUDRAFT_103736 [Cronartium quercuum f. sp. fusiforme G11]
MASTLLSNPEFKNTDDPWNAVPPTSAISNPVVNDGNGVNLTPGSFHISPQLPSPSIRQWNHSGRIQTAALPQPPHPAGVIGSSRPGSSIDQIKSTITSNPRDPKNQTLDNPFSGSTNEEDDRVLLLDQPKTTDSALSETNQQPEPLFKTSDDSAGYTLSSSMWATPHSQVPPTRLYDFNKNTIPLRSHESKYEENNLQQTGADSGFQKPEPISSFDSPELSFSQTASAPSTNRSFLTAHGSTNHVVRSPLTVHFNRDQIDGQSYSLGFKSIDYASTPSRGLGKENGEKIWPLPLSLGEEAFYSKSNITKPSKIMNNESPQVRREASPSFWETPSTADHTSSSTTSPPKPGPQCTLGSPFLAPKYITELMNQMIMRIDQLERTLAKQDLDISTLKSGLSSVSNQPVSLKPPIPNAPTNGGLSVLNQGRGPNHQAVQATSVNTSTGKPLPTPALGPPPTFAGHPLQPQRINPSHTPPNNLPEHMNSLNGSVKPPGFAPRQYGPLDYGMGRSISFTGTVPVVHQSGMPTGLPSAPLANTHLPGGLGGGVNYRTLLAGDTDCDYEFFIRRITEHNDQQSSIFLQQKLKQSAVATSVGLEKTQVLAPMTNPNGPRVEITRLVIEYSLELMSNRFGNFLVSRAIEHATAEERMNLAERIRGHIIPLASDTFATHCLQKMIDVDEDENNKIRGLISQELLKKKETVTHKSAGHVWARLLSVGGSSSAMHLHASGLKVKKPNGLNQYGSGVGSPGELERSLNELLKGQWAKTAKDEVGSLIVQSVLENWSEAEKTDVIEELLADIYSCAIQQWGNFVILHLIEHSSGSIQKRLFDRLTETQLACELSIDNFGAKAIEKVMKVAGMDSSIVEDYVRGICEYGHGRPALIEIACHQAGAQVLTLLFTSAPNPIRELMIQTVRRNGVTMKSSKAGSKIWFLVERTRAWVGH